MRICAIPGSFDPVTSGHLDIIERAASLFDGVVVGLLHNANKKYLFTIEERLSFLSTATEHLPNVSIEAFDGLAVTFAKQTGALALVRGLRNVADFEVEEQMAALNRRMGMESAFFMSAPEHLFISSSMVRDIGLHGGDLMGLVPDAILDGVYAALRAHQ